MANVQKSHPIHDFKASVRAAFCDVHDGPPLRGPLCMSIVFVMPRPQSMRWKRRATPRVPYVAHRNDWDNLGKGVCDALNGIAYEDDGQIYKAHVSRWVAAGDERPHVRIVIMEDEAK